MQDATRVLINPILKDKITFLKTTAETNGEYVQFRVELAPGGQVLWHYHTAFTERFEVVDGELHVDLNGEHLVLETGQTTLVPLHAAHRFHNPSSKPITFIAEVRPARQFEKNLRISYGLARDGKSTARGIARNPLYLAVTFQYAETYVPGFPAWVQKAAFAPLAIVARMLGVDKALVRRYLSESAPLHCVDSDRD
jgi:mannose-6-phosphate isomerase-like protein (cupin superfamily)